MKKRLAVLFAGLLLLTWAGTAFAGELHLTAEVPESHTVSVDSDGGRVIADGMSCGSQVEVERHKEQTYWILPDPGKVLERLIYDGEDVTDQVKNGVFTAPSLTDDAELTAVFAGGPAAPDGKEYGVSGTLEDEDGNPMAGVIVEIGGISGTTGEDGSFILENVPSGVHTVTVSDEAGKLLGHGQLIIEAAEGTELTLTADENGCAVIRPGTGTKQIRLSLVLKDDGTIEIRGAEDVTQRPQLPQLPGSIFTGEGNGVVWWLAFLLAGGAALLAFRPGRRKKHRDL